LGKLQRFNGGLGRSHRDSEKFVEASGISPFNNPPVFSNANQDLLTRFSDDL